MTVVGTLACWYYKDLSRLCSQHVTRIFRYEEAVSMMGAALLAVDQKQTWMNISQACLDIFKHKSTEFYVIASLLMKCGFTITRQKQSSSTNRGRIAMKKVKCVPSAGKLMTTLLFWDSHDVVVIDYLA